MRLAAWLALSALACASAVADEPARELTQLIEGSTSLAQLFDVTTIRTRSPQRAQVVTEHDGQRHALVMFRRRPSSTAINEGFCHAALGEPEQAAWRSRLMSELGIDPAIADILASQSAPTLRLRRVEHGALKSPDGWQAVACVVRLKDLQAEYPSLPGQQEIDQARYQWAKALYAAARYDDALNQLKALRNSELYFDALLYVVAALEAKHSPLAKTLRQQHVRLEETRDIDALRVYVNTSNVGGHLADAQAAQRRCIALGQDC